jgi:hypothetical protein
MGFVYGDSTPSPLETNFLELLRDALDFSVVLLRADENIRGLLKRKHADSRAADVETERLVKFGGVVTAAIQDAQEGGAESETARCAARLVTATSEGVTASVEAVRTALAERVALTDAEEAAERETVYKALETLLLPHAPPSANVTVRLERSATGAYSANVAGDAPLGLTWRIDLAIPEGHTFTSPLPIERLIPQLEISAPAPAGWLKKELKVRPQRLERLILAEVVDDGRSVALKLRMDVGSDEGFDFDVNPREQVVSAVRTAAKGGASGAFDVSPEDAAKLVSLAEKLREAIAEIKGGRLVEATFDGNDFRALPVFEDMVERLVTLLAPIVKEISRHSLTQTELVIRRLLGNDRREEIFVAKSTLREKYAHLRAAQRSLFDALGLEVGGSVSPAPVVEAEDRRATRSELPRSEPPPPRVSSMPPFAESLPPDDGEEIQKPPPLPRISRP